MDLKPIEVYPLKSYGNIYESNYREAVDKSSEKREWFDSFLYSQETKEANSLGITIFNTDECEVEWDGSKGASGVKIYSEPIKQLPEIGFFPTFYSEVGYGIVTVDCPLLVNLPGPNPYLLTAPLNSFLPNLTVISRVIRPESFNQNIKLKLKIEIPNIRTRIYKETPLATLFPIVDPQNYKEQSVQFVEERK